MWWHLHKRGRNMWVFLRNTETAFGRRTGNWSPGLSLRRGSGWQPGRSRRRWSVTCPFLCLKKCLNHLQVLTSLIFNRVAKVVHHRWSVKYISPINGILCSWQNLKSCLRVYRASQAPISSHRKKAKMLMIPWGCVWNQISWPLVAPLSSLPGWGCSHSGPRQPRLLGTRCPLCGVSPGRPSHPAHLHLMAVSSGTVPPLYPPPFSHSLPTHHPGTPHISDTVCILFVLLIILQIRGWQTRAPRPDSTCGLFLYGPCATNSFKKKRKERNH